MCNAEIVAELLAEWIDARVRIMREYASDFESGMHAIVDDARAWADRLGLAWETVPIPRYVLDDLARWETDQ